MGELIVKQYLHRPNITELGLGNTNETYLLVNTEFDLSDMFPPAKEVNIKEFNSSKIYTLKSAKNNEFRINQMGEIYRDFNVVPGDEIIITALINENSKRLAFKVDKYDRVVLKIDNQKRTEVINLDKLRQYEISTNCYLLDVNGNEKLKITFDNRENKRRDSPDLTDYYKVEFNDEVLDSLVTVNDDTLFSANVKVICMFSAEPAYVPATDTVTSGTSGTSATAPLYK